MKPEKPSYWLMKSEPDVFSIDHLARLGTAPWDGVRNFQARNHMRAMKVGDVVLFYHSSCEPKGVAGIARVMKTAYPDHTQFDPTNDHFDARAKPEDPRWSMVDVEFVEKFSMVYTLEQMKSDPKLEGMLVGRRGMRLSVQPVEAKHALRVIERARGKKQRG